MDEREVKVDVGVNSEVHSKYIVQVELKDDY